MNYQTLLKENDLKVTPQRLELLSLMDTKGHISVEAMYEEIQKKFSAISLATLYKNINLMMDKQVVTEVKIPHEKSRYEISKETHSHLHCRECGEVVDIFLDFSKAVAKVEKLSHYKIEGENIIFSGLCPKCQTSHSNESVNLTV